MEFPSGLAGEESRVVTAVAAVTAVAQVQSLVQELLHIMDVARKKIMFCVKLITSDICEDVELWPLEPDSSINQQEVLSPLKVLVKRE